MSISFAINAGAAFAPGICPHPEWGSWAQSRFVLLDEAAAALPQFPAMVRRRLSALGRMAVAVADAALHDSSEAQRAQMPIVWASRYGDATRSLALLAEQIQSQPLSPTAFGLSVHNGIGSQYSIARGIVLNAVSVAAGIHTAEAGMVEAVALMADGAPEVLLVCYDAPLPGSYSVFHDEPMAEYAWAVRVSLEPASSDAIRFSLSGDRCNALTDQPCHAAELPHGLAVLQYLLSGRNVLESHHAGQFWQWSRPHG